MKKKRSKTACDAIHALHNPGMRLTPIRAKVYNLISKSTKPKGAYALLEQLKKNNPGAAPPTVYRALDYLVEKGLVHRVEKLNAYVACHYPYAKADETAQFLICTKCGTTEEIEHRSLGKKVLQEAEEKGFIVNQTILEMVGICADCQ